MIRFLLKTYGLKDQVRTGWVLRGIERPESVADHSWGTALLTMLFGAAEGIDVDRAVRIALAHDLAEAVTGDVATRVATMDDPAVRAAKQLREERAMEELLGLIAEDRNARKRNGRAVRAAIDGDIQVLWKEYEERLTPEALFVRDMNLIDLCLQALVYESQERYRPEAGQENFPDFGRLDEFFATSGPRLVTDTGRELFREIENDYRLLTGRTKLDP